MAVLCMCVCKQEGGQAGTPGATRLSTKTGSVLLLSHMGKRIKIYMHAEAVQESTAAAELQGKCE